MPPLARVFRTPRPPSFDGPLDDALWEAAPALALSTPTGGTPPRATAVRLLYDADALYVRFDCEDDYVWGTLTARDAPVWEEECVEVFLNPAGSAHQYYELNVSPLGTVFDACLLNPRTPAAPSGPFVGLPQWDAQGLRTAAYVDGALGVPGGARLWRAAYAIPFAALIGAPHQPPRPGDAWRANFCRIDAPTPGRRDHYAWSPTGGDFFHRPWCFGTLRFA